MQHGGTQDERLSETADLSTAQTQVQQDTLALASLQKLQAQGAASANEVAAAQQRLDAAKARVAQLQTRRSGRYSGDDLTAQKAQVAQAQAAVAAARTVFAGVDIRAPFAGTVYAVPVAQYQFVPAGETLLQLADLTKLQIKAYFDEPEIGQLKPGQPVTIKWPAKPLQLWHGHVVQVPTTITAYGGTRNVGECLIAVDDANGDLLPNTNVTVRVIEQHSDNVMILPREALHTDGTDNYVYRVVKEHLVKTPIKLGKVVNLTRFEIEGGLNPGDTVALRAITDFRLPNHTHRPRSHRCARPLIPVVLVIHRTSSGARPLPPGPQIRRTLPTPGPPGRLHRHPSAPYRSQSRRRPLLSSLVPWLIRRRPDR
jgi:HlyD family secretion protein